MCFNYYLNITKLDMKAKQKVTKVSPLYIYNRIQFRKRHIAQVAKITEVSIN